MIFKDVNFCGNSVYSLLQFGSGDIAVTDATGKVDNKDNYTAVVFKNIQAIPVGDTVTEAGDIRKKSIREFPPEVVMVFSKTESIDVVIRSLKLAKKKLKAISV